MFKTRGFLKRTKQVEPTESVKSLEENNTNNEDEYSDEIKECADVSLGHENTDKTDGEVEEIIGTIRAGFLSIANEKILRSTNPYKVCDLVLETLRKDYDSIDPDSWIWVDGYKATEKDMTCLDYKFTIGDVYTVDGEVEECKNGFHLCTELKDVFKYYSIYKKPFRYFKVRALVNEKEFYRTKNKIYSRLTELYNHKARGMTSREYDIRRNELIESNIKNKLVSKSIVFKEELGFNDLVEYIPDKVISSEEEWFEAQQYGDYNCIIKKYAINDLVENGLSEVLANVIIDKIEGMSNIVNIGSSHYSVGRFSYDEKFDVCEFSKNVREFRCKFTGLIESGVSIDMCMYLLKEYL